MKEILTISREFGSGGRTIGREVANRLGYKFYDSELVTKIVEESDYDAEYIRKFSEETPYTNSFLYSLSMHSRLGGGELSSVKNQLYLEQFNIIRELAKKEPCVIVGRCSDYILRDYEDCCHVHIYADDRFRENRIVEQYGEKTDSPKKRIKDKDKKRINYYEYYTGRKWGISKNFNLCLDSGYLGIEKSVEMIISAME